MSDTFNEVQEALGPPVCIFRAYNLPGTRFELRPITRPAPDKTVAILYMRNGDNFRQAGVGCCFEGSWRRSQRGAPLEGAFHWALMVSEMDGAPLLLGVTADG